MKIVINATTQLEFHNGFWGVVYSKPTNHHLSKGEETHYTDHCGDLNKTLVNLLQNVPKEDFAPLLTTYKKALRSFKEADTFTFDKKVVWKINDVEVKTNKNYHGVMCEYKFLSTQMKETKDTMTMPNHRGIAEMLVSKNVYSYVKENTVEGLSSAIEQFSQEITESMANAKAV